MILIYESFPTDPPEYELFMVVPSHREEIFVNWPFNDSTNWLSVKAGGSEFIQGATQFSVADACSIASIVVPIRSMKPASPGSSAVRIELRHGAVDGLLLTDSQVVDFNSSGQYVEKEFTLSSPIALHPGTAYWIVVVLVSVTGGECLYQMPVKPGPNCSYRLSQSGAWVNGNGQVPLRLIKG